MNVVTRPHEAWGPALPPTQRCGFRHCQHPVSAHFYETDGPPERKFPSNSDKGFREGCERCRCNGWYTPYAALRRMTK